MSTAHRVPGELTAVLGWVVAEAHRDVPCQPAGEPASGTMASTPHRTHTLHRPPGMGKQAQHDRGQM